WLGLMAFGGAVILLTLTFLTESRSRAPTRAMTQDAGLRAAVAELARRSSETVVAMGMAATLAERWQRVNDRYLAAAARASDVVGTYGSVSKILRLLLQSTMLGLGAYLVIRQELTAGAMIAASIMMGRALAPIEVAIANWRGFITARQSIARLSDALTRTQAKKAGTSLPKPTRDLQVEQLIVA